MNASTAHSRQTTLEEIKEDFSQDKNLELERIKKTHTEELVISLCGFVGIELDDISRKIHDILNLRYGYKCQQIKLTDIIKQWSELCKGVDFESMSQYERTGLLIRGGNELRGDPKYGRDFLIRKFVEQVAIDRLKDKDKDKDKSYKSRRKCYIINSIKNQSELELLKEIYGGIHYCFGVFSPISKRENYLRGKQMTDEQIETLIDIDSGEDIDHGQAVRKTFTDADFFLRIESGADEELNSKIRRFIDLIFGSEIITPTIHEAAMQMAASAAGNSACLSRQVGAALTDEKGEVLSVGWNDVPKYGGGLYQSSSEGIDGEQETTEDCRCFLFKDKEKGLGCRNDWGKDNILNDLKKVLIESGINQDKTTEVLNNINNSKIRIKDLIEFSRAIHAEIHAIIIGSQKAGEKVKGGKLYVTTYPCHLCAKGIITAGIKEVYFVEPYRKSLTIELHSDAITEEENAKDDGKGEADEKVKILMFEGVSPSRYVQLFRMIEDNRKEKGSGKLKISSQEERKSMFPRYARSLEALPKLESSVKEKLKNEGLGEKEDEK